MRRLTCLVLLGLSNMGYGSSVVFQESIHGDLSDDYLAPTQLSFSTGSNVVTGALTGNSNDVDLFTFEILPGQSLTEIRVLEFTGGVSGSFMGMQYGTTLSAAPSSSFGDPIGYILVSAPLAEAGSNVLPQLTVGPPFNFANPLSDASYVVWLNETSSASTYSIEFVVIPEPQTFLIPAFCFVFTLVFLKRRQ